MREPISPAGFLQFLPIEFLEEVEDGDAGCETARRYFPFVALVEGEEGEMLYDYGVGLFASGCFVCDGVKRPFDAVDGHPHLVAVVHTHPPEPHRLHLLLELRVHAKPIPVVVMHQGHPQL
jgi:hypothetical protein